jgi:hypothetical protein
LAYERGFYDYPDGAKPDATADDAFRTLEREFPLVRERIRGDRTNWIRHRETLVSFAAMLAARSPLFRVQSISGVLPSLADRANSAVMAKSYSITTMRAEMQRRAQEWLSYHWALGYTEDPSVPVITSDQSIGMRGAVADQGVAYASDDFWLWFPVSWDMCLVGSSKPLDAYDTVEFSIEHLAELQSLTYQQARRFVVSPVRLPDLSGR